MSDCPPQASALLRQEDGEEGEGGPEAAFEAYCCAVENSAAWGGQLELRALAQALRRHIAVYSVGMPRVDMGPEFQGGSPFNQACPSLRTISL